MAGNMPWRPGCLLTTYARVSLQSSLLIVIPHTTVPQTRLSGTNPENPGSQGFRVATDRCSPCSCIHRGENGQGGNGASRDARWNPVHATRDERRCCVLRRAMRRQGPPRRGAVSTPPELLVPNPLTPTVVLPPSSRITGGARVLCQETARGRALFATRAFAAGEQVLRERPLVAIQVCLRAEIAARTVND